MANEGTSGYIQVKKDDWENLNWALRNIYNQLDSLTGQRGLSPSPSQKYIPVVSNLVNLSEVLPNETQYVRIGNTVLVFGAFSANPVTTTTATGFEMSLPFPPRFTKLSQAGGTAFAPGISGQGAAISANVNDGTAQISWKSVDVTLQLWSFIFGYAVVPA